MLETMVEQHQAALCRNTMCITTAELQQLKNAVTVLQPFQAATRETSAEKGFSPLKWWEGQEKHYTLLESAY